MRLIRGKKPWALAASALILLGLTFLFTLGDYRVLAKVTTPQFKEAVTQAKTVSKTGRGPEDRLREGQGRCGSQVRRGHSADRRPDRPGPAGRSS